MSRQRPSKSNPVTIEKKEPPKKIDLTTSQSFIDSDENSHSDSQESIDMDVITDFKNYAKQWLADNAILILRQEIGNYLKTQNLEVTCQLKRSSTQKQLKRKKSVANLSELIGTGSTEESDGGGSSKKRKTE